MILEFEPMTTRGTPWERGRPARPGRTPARDNPRQAHYRPCGRDARAPGNPDYACARASSVQGEASPESGESGR